MGAIGGSLGVQCVLLGTLTTVVVRVVVGRVVTHEDSRTQNFVRREQASSLAAGP